jgi:dsDNA-specific endonuclease/ATPase MutS2
MDSIEKAPLTHKIGAKGSWQEQQNNFDHDYYTKGKGYEDIKNQLISEGWKSPGEVSSLEREWKAHVKAVEEVAYLKGNTDGLKTSTIQIRQEAFKEAADQVESYLNISPKHLPKLIEQWRSGELPGEG